MRNYMIHFRNLLLVLVLVCACALPAYAADIDLGVDIQAIENGIRVTVKSDIPDGVSAKLEVPCDFEAASVGYAADEAGTETPLAADDVILNTETNKITFPVTGKGTYTIHKRLVVTFDSKGGSSVSDQKVAVGGKAVCPANPTKTGSLFAGWYSDSECSTVWDFDSTVTASMTLYAKWNEAVTVTFNSNGGSTVASQTVAKGGKITQPDTPTRAGYTFVNWYQNAECTTVWNFATNTVPDSDTSMTLYAKWSENPLSGITVTPAGKKLYPGDTQTFTAALTGTAPTGTTVTWAVSGNTDTDTKISTTGQLVIGSKETPKTLTVTATGKLGNDSLSYSVEVKVCPVYEFKSGSGSKWAKDSTRNLVFQVTGPQAKLKDIQINGQSIAALSSTYLTTEASDTGTKITLKPAFLKTLARGSYEIYVEYTDDGYAVGTFQVIRASGIAYTRDLFNMALWGSLLGISALGVIILVIAKKRKK